MEPLRKWMLRERSEHALRALVDLRPRTIGPQPER
jgi:hypothetical protein